MLIRATSDEAALLAAICAHPEEDTPRLMYADEIQDRDPARAEFIRLQCYLEQVESDPTNLVIPAVYKAARKREREFLEHHSHEWFAVPPLHIPEPSYFAQWWATDVARGFRQRLTCAAADWLVHGDAISAAHPVTKVRLTAVYARPEVFEDGYLEDRWPHIEFGLDLPAATNAGLFE